MLSRKYRQRSDDFERRSLPWEGEGEYLTLGGEKGEELALGGGRGGRVDLGKGGGGRVDQKGEELTLGRRKELTLG